MNRWIANTLGIVSICAVCLVGWAAWRFGVMSNSVKVPDMTVSVAKLNQTLDAVNAPCVGFHGSVTCGPLAQLSQTIKNVGILAGQSADQVKQTGILVTATAQNLNTVGDSVKQAADSLSGAATALTDTAQAATGTLQEGQRTLAAVEPVLGHADATVTDADAFLNANTANWTAIGSNVAGMTASGNATLADVHIWSHAFLNPAPCADFKCRLGRYVWPVVKSAAGLGADANQIRLLTGHPLPVTVR